MSNGVSALLPPFRPKQVTCRAGSPLLPVLPAPTLVDRPRSGQRLLSRPHQQLSFRTLCSSEALARERTIFRVSFIAAGLSPLCPLAWLEDEESVAAGLQGAGAESSGADPANPLAT